MSKSPENWVDFEQTLTTEKGVGGGYPATYIICEGKGETVPERKHLETKLKMEAHVTKEYDHLEELEVQ